MMKILILISSFAIAALSFTQTYEWGIQYGNTTDAQTTNITTDANGNVYAVGTFSGVLDCDPSAATQNVTSNGNIDFFITKVSPSGTLIWVKSIGGSANDYAKTVVTDQVGDVYIGGSYQSTVDFDPNAGVASRTSATVDAFILKLDSDGNFIWVNTFGGTSNADVCYSLDINSQNQLLATGYFVDVADFDPGPGVTNLTGNGFADIFIAKYTSSGGLVWAKQIGSPGSDVAQSIAVDQNDAVYVTGWYRQTMDVDPGPGVTTLSSGGTASGNQDIFLLKLDDAGDFVFGFGLGGVSNDIGYGVAVDNNNDVIITGYYIYYQDFDPGPGVYTLNSVANAEGYVAKYSSTGQFIWAKGIVGNGANLGYDIAIDQSNNIFVSGRFNQTVNFNTESGPSNISSAGAGDIFIWMLDAAGNSKWVRQIGGANNDECFAIEKSFLSDGNIYIAGFVDGNVDMDPNAGTAVFSSTVGTDGYLVKLNYCSPYSFVVNQTACTDYYWDATATTYTTSGNYVYNALAASGCDSTITLNLTINTATMPSVSINNSVLEAQPSGFGITYQWIDCADNNSEINGEVGQYYTPSGNGNYSVIITDANGCQDTASCFVLSNLGISEKEISSIDVLPNPFNSELTITTVLQNYSVTISSINGQSISISQNNSGNTKINTESIIPGVYFIRVQSELGINKIVKLVKY